MRIFGNAMNRHRVARNRDRHRHLEAGVDQLNDHFLRDIGLERSTLPTFRHLCRF